MDFQQKLNQFWESLIALDLKKQIGLGAGFALLVVGIFVLTNYLNKPTTVVLYSNLSQQDVNNMSRALSQNGVAFNVSTNNDAIMVSPGTVTRARMLLAESGLPSSSKSGYELFDKVNTLGLTSFMQNVTNKRAIQGELARTIQMISGVKSARVHLVTAEKSVFRSKLRSAPSASLVISTFGRLPNKTISAIRHMVAAAVPGLDTGNVTIVGADGTLLTSKGGEAGGGVSRLVELENEFEREAERKIVAALGAHLGSSNFRISVTAKLNSDQRRVDETKFDPESRVERSFRSVKENNTAQNKATSQPTTVTQNLPDENESANPGQTSQENKERREETTNYEINTKKTSLISNGYQIERLSVALIVDKARLTQLLGETPDKKEIEAKINELEEIIRSSISLSDERNDLINVSFVEFLADEIAATDAAPSRLETFINIHLGSILNSIALIVGALVLALLGMRPLLAFLSRSPTENIETSRLALASQNTAQIDQATDEISVSQTDSGTSGDSDLEKITARETAIRGQLENLISQNEERVAIAIRQWLEPEKARQ